MIKEWEKREVLEDKKSFMKKHPSVAAFTAGKKNGESVVKVILREDDPEAKESIRKGCQISPKPLFQFVCFEKGNKLKDRKSESTITKIDTEKRKEIDKIITKESRKILAKHSHIVGIGIGQIDTKPCIVFYCLDKQLVPFGEEKLPHVIGDEYQYPVDVREDMVTFGHCKKCKSVNYGCSISRSSVTQTGSVGFLARSKRSLLVPEEGFLTAAHIAIDCLLEAYAENNQYDKSECEIVHPSYEDNQNRNTIVGRVSEAFCGNFGQDRVGIDAAFVKVDEINLEGKPINCEEL